MANGIVLNLEEELERRVKREPKALEESGLDPLTYIKRVIEKVADENPITTVIVVEPSGKHGIRFHAQLDMKKVAALVRSAQDG